MGTSGGFGRSFDIRTDILYDFSCTPCAYNNRNEEAERYCVECRKYFCGSCFKDHNKLAIMRAHQILDKIGMSAMEPQQTERCQEHNGHIIDAYCPVHQSVGCGTCIALKHGSCKGISYIPKVAKGFKKTKEFKDIIPAIESSLQQLQAFKITIHTDLEDLHKERDVALNDIKEYRKSIEKELDRMERNITDEVHTKCKSLQTEIEANRKSIEYTISKLDSHLKKLESIKAENEASIFVCVKEGNMKIAESDELLQNSKRGSLKFKKNSAIDECIKRFELLGELHDEICKTSDHQAVSILTQKQNRLCSASLIGEYNVKVKADKNICDIHGCTFLDDKVLLIADCENKKLKRLDSSFQITDFCDMPDSPYGLCVTDNKEVAVALPEESTVQFVSVGKYLKLSQSFTTKGRCTGLAYSNGNLCISNEDTNDVHMYSKNGQCLRTITVDISHLSSLYVPITYISLSKDHSKLVFSNENNGIIIVNVKDGQNDCICTDQMSAAQGLCVLDNDNILVADCNSNAILQITGDGHMLGVVVQKKEGIKGAQSVCVDKANSRLIVTSLDNNKISVFKLIK